MKKYLYLVLIIIIIVVVILTRKTDPVVVSPSPSLSPAVTPSPILTSVSPLDLSYEVDDEMVTLVKGTSVRGAGTPEEVTTEVFGTQVVGDIGAGKDTTVMFLDQQTSGTGIFFYIVAAYKVADGKYMGTKAGFIGDRIAPQNIRIVNGVAEVNYAERKEGEPMSTEPSQGVTKRFVIKDGELVEK